MRKRRFAGRNRVVAASHRLGRPHRQRRLAEVQPLEPRTLLSTYVVNNASDPALRVQGITLRTAIADANNHPGPDTITFSPTVFPAGSLHTITLTRGELLLSDTSGATTITGPGASTLAISGNSASRIFQIASGVTANISGLTLTGGVGSQDKANDPTYRGGAILSHGNLTVASSTLTGNRGGSASATDVSGGAIFSDGTLTVKNSTLSGNSVSSVAGSLGRYLDGGAIYAAGPTDISASEFDDNSAHAMGGGFANGGAICAVLKAALTITSSSFKNNSALGGDVDRISETNAGGGAEGGAIESTYSTTLVSCTITGNMAVGGSDKYYMNGGATGGGISGFGPTVVTNCEITDNLAVAGNGYFSDKHTTAPEAIVPARGGGIDNDGQLTLTNSTVSGNSAIGGATAYQYVRGCAAEGGGVYIADFVGRAETVTISGSSITGNNVTGGAGSPSHRAIIVVPAAAGGPGGNAQGAGVFISADVSDGGAVNARITNSTIANNTATGGTGGSAAKGAPNGVTKAGAGGSASGGGIYSIFPITLLDSTVSGNIANGGAGGAGYVPTSGSGLSPIAPGNRGSAVGGGITSFSLPKIAPLLENSILSADKANGAFNDIQGKVSGSHNLIGVGGGLSNGVNGNKVGVNNPDLQPLGNYGGATATMLPMAASPAIDAGSNALIPAGVTTDQRGLPRIFGNSVDIGADEYIALVVSGSIFKDINGDGIKQSNEPGLAKWQVYIDLANTGVYQRGDPLATTDANGNYKLTFTPTSTKSLILREVRQTNWRQTRPSSPGFYTISPIAGSVANENFGNSTTALISGAVFNDANNNGKQDSGEKGMADVRVYVDLNKDGKFESSERSDLTDANGNWSIAGLAPASYVIRVVPPKGYKTTVPTSGSLSLTLTSGQTVTGKLFGEHALA